MNNIDPGIYIKTVTAVSANAATVEIDSSFFSISIERKRPRAERSMKNSTRYGGSHLNNLFTWV